ncbi:TniQ family protein [Streptomyces sp. NRRL B-24572]|uniref:TniQ family protein n=1 Tax=Streptomyces sp. NRRL B-24572 TaxID=1962156 RepID=UPI0015C4F8A4|nr:TniQ family protein [Streptomyces sp. NRRL B-24572]
MTDVRDRHRRLSRSLAPLPEESLAGFLLRLSFRLERSPRRITELLGLGQRHSSIAYAHLRILPAPLAAQFAHRAHISTEEAHALTLQRFAQTYPALRRVRADTPRIGGTALAQWAMTPSSRFCPECLRGNDSPVQNVLGGAWHLRWHLPVTFACVRHGRLLEHTCPTCDLPLNSPEDRRPGLLKLPNTAGLHPAQCRNRSMTVGPPADESSGRFAALTSCGARLDANPRLTRAALSARELEQLLALQGRVDQNLISCQKNSEIRKPSDPFYFPDLITTTHLIKLSWPVARYLVPSDALIAAIDAHASPIVSAITARDSGSGALTLRGSRDAPADAMTSGALLLAADNLLVSRDRRTIAEHIEPIASEAFRRAKDYTKHLLNDGGISPSLTVATSPHVSAFRVRGRLRNSPYSHQFTVDEVPPYLPLDWFSDHFTDLRTQLPDVTYRDDRLLRRGASLRLVELVTGLTWPECAEALEVGSGVGRYTLNALGRRLTENRLGPAFTRAVEQVAELLATSIHRINYANRRHRMSRWSMGATHWSRLFEELPRLTLMRTSADPRIASIIVWSDVTRAEAPQCPIVKKERGRGDARLLTSRTSALHEADIGRGERFRLRQRLSLYATQLAAACDQNLPLYVSVRAIIEEETRTRCTSRLRSS